MAEKFNCTKAEMAVQAQNLLDALALLVAMGGMASEQWQNGQPVTWGVYGEVESKIVNLAGQGDKKHDLLGITIPLGVIAHLQKVGMNAVSVGLKKPDNPDAIPALAGGPVIMRIENHEPPKGAN